MFFLCICISVGLYYLFVRGRVARLPTPSGGRQDGQCLRAQRHLDEQLQCARLEKILPVDGWLMSFFIGNKHHLTILVVSISEKWMISDDPAQWGRQMVERCG